MDMETAWQFNIIEGPERHKLFTAFEYTFDNEVEISSSFTIELNGYKIPFTDIKIVRVTSIQYMNHSGENLRICGRCQAQIECLDIIPLDGIYHFVAIYNAETHKGKILLTIQLS